MKKFLSLMVFAGTVVGVSGQNRLLTFTSPQNLLNANPASINDQAIVRTNVVDTFGKFYYYCSSCTNATNAGLSVMMPTNGIGRWIQIDLSSTSINVTNLSFNNNQFVVTGGTNVNIVSGVVVTNIVIDSPTFTFNGVTISNIVQVPQFEEVWTNLTSYIAPITFSNVFKIFPYGTIVSGTNVGPFWNVDATDAIIYVRDNSAGESNILNVLFSNIKDTNYTEYAEWYLQFQGTTSSNRIAQALLDTANDDGMNSRWTMDSRVGANPELSRLFFTADGVNSLLFQPRVTSGTVYKMSSRNVMVPGDKLLSIANNEVEALSVEPSASGSKLVFSPSGEIVWDGSTNSVYDLVGTGNPEGVVTKSPGSFYRNLSGGTGTTLYYKASGAGNTGWVAVTSGSGATINSLDDYLPVRSNSTTFANSPLYRVGVTNIATDGQIIFGPGTTNVLYRDVSSLVYTNNTTGIMSFSIKNGTGKSASLTITSANDLQVQSSAGENVRLSVSGSGTLVFDGTQFFPDSARGITLGVKGGIDFKAYTAVETVNTTQVGNVSTGEDDLMVRNLPSALLSVNKDYLTIVCSGSFTNNANLKQVKAYFGATQLFASGSLAFNTGDWVLRSEIIRTSSTNQIAHVTWVCSNALLSTTAVISTPAETLANSITFKLTGEATASDDIVQKTETILFHTSP